MKTIYVLFVAFSFLAAPLDLLSASNGKIWECKRTDVIHPQTEYPLSYTDDYLVQAYYLLFHSFLKEEDRVYMDALRQISFKDLDKAQQLLEHLIIISPNYTYAYTQLGFVYLWQGKLAKAKEAFDAVLRHCLCNEECIGGLSQLAIASEGYEDRQDFSLEVYRDLLICFPDKYEYLSGLGRALARTHHWKEAEKVLKECLEIRPADSDVGIQLANLYFWEGKYEEAEKLYARFQDRIEAQEGLGKLALMRSDFKQAEERYLYVTENQPENMSALQNLARSYVNELKFTKAKEVYQQLVEKYPHHESGWAELLDVKLHTDPVLNYNVNYYEAKENDPGFKEPVVRDYYFDTNAVVFIPIRDQWRVDLKTYFDWQREKEILPANPGINYNVGLSGAAVYSHVYFWSYWKWDLFCDVKSAWNVGHNAYPFQNTTRIEPGSYLSYTSERQMLVVGGNIDSYIIKNFSTFVSQLLTLKSLEATYRYTIPVKYSPEVEGWFQETYYESMPRNKRDSEAATFRIYVPFLEEYLKAFYTYEHKHFNKLNVNYYSFMQQWRNTFGFSFFLKSEKRRASFDLTYWHRVQKTKDLFQPIGDFVFITPLQILHCNQIDAALRFRMKDNFRMEFLGGYYRDTLPYRVWNVRTSFFWAF